MGSSRHSTRQKPVESEWGSRFVDPSSTPMGADYGQTPIDLGAQYSNSLCRPAWTTEFSSTPPSEFESRTKAAFEMRKLPSIQPDRPGILAYHRARDGHDRELDHFRSHDPGYGWSTQQADRSEILMVITPSRDSLATGRPRFGATPPICNHFAGEF
jgi:hypothetical protein